MELVIQENRITEVVHHAANVRESQKMDRPLPISNWIDRKAFFLHKEKSGTHTVGGNRPRDLKLPTYEKLASPFIYISTIDGNDHWFDWLGLDQLHIAYPVYEGAFETFLDYNDPNAPVIMNTDTFSYSWIDDKAKGVDKVEYVQQRYKAAENFSVKKVEEERDGHLLCGVPLWYQAPQIPTCPKTGELMSYVTTINSDALLTLIDKTGIEHLPFGNYLVFGDHGHLYVFYHPGSKVLHLNVQF